MFNFFKRSKSRIDQQQACAADAAHRRKSDGNRNEAQSIQQQYENDSIGERAPKSNSTKNGFFDIMAKGKNRRNYGKNKQSTQQQQQQCQSQKLKNNETVKVTPPSVRCKKQYDANAQHKPSVEIKSDKLDSWPPEAVEPKHDGISPKNNQKYVKTFITANNNDEKIHCVSNSENDNANQNGARHNDRNSEQNGACTDDSSDTADFVKGIIFEKYKRPLSPIYTRSPIEVEPETAEFADITTLTPNMGQQPTKHQQIITNREYYRKIRTPPASPPGSPVSSPLHTPLSSPPETPSIGEKLSPDEKDVFYEASENGTTLIPETVEYAIGRFDFPVTVSSEKCDKSNYANDPSATDTFPSNGMNTLPIVVNAGDLDYGRIIINNNANLNGVQGKLHNDHDSPDSGVDIDSDTADILCVVTNKTYPDCMTNGNGKSTSAFNEQLENLNNSNYNDCESLTNGIQCDKNFNKTTKINLISNGAECDERNDGKHSSQKQKSDEQPQLQKSLQNKKLHLLEDAISLPDVVVGNMGSPEDMKQNCHENGHTQENGIKKRDLVNQESKYTARLEEAEKEAIKSQTKADNLACQVNELERNLTIKTWNVERIQAELQAAYTEGDCVKKKLKLQEGELEKLRTKLNEAEEDFNCRYNDLESRHDELKEKLTQLQKLAMTLQIQLAEAQCDATDCRKEKERCLTAHEAEEHRLQDALNNAMGERKKLETKWHTEFEHLRTVNSDREEQLLNDCEWKIRSTEQSCKAKITAAENARRRALDKAKEIEAESNRQINEVKHLKSYEAEVAQLRGLTSEQRESINSMTQQIEELKSDLKDANKTVEESLISVRKIKFQCEQEISDKDRQMIFKIDEARGEVAVMWEDRLMEEMGRLKIELEACYAEDRADSLQKAYAEHLEEIAKLTSSFNIKEKQLIAEITELKAMVSDRDYKLQEAKDKSDKQIMQIRVILDKSEREHQREMDCEIQKRQEAIESLQSEHENDKQEMEEKFRERLTDVTEEFAKELANNKEELIARHKKQLEQQWEKLMAEKEETVQNLDRNYKRKLTDADTKLRDLEITHHREMKDMKNAYAMERSSLEQRDLQNSQEIETLHRKCRCLTKLFEEMRMRYERRDPRQEDIREIEELKTRLEYQDRDLRKLTEKYRELQMLQQQSSQNQQQTSSSQRKQKSKKSQKINCDVIYEENEDRESPPANVTSNTIKGGIEEPTNSDDED